MDLRQLNDYALVTVYVCQTLYDQLFGKAQAMNEPKDKEHPSHLQVADMRNCRKVHTACKWLYNESFKM